MRPTVKVSSASVSSMRVFQKRRPSGSPSAVTRAGEQFEEEVGVVGVKGPQALGHDLDGLAGPRSALVEVPDGLDEAALDGGCKTGVNECVVTPFAVRGCWLRVCRQKMPEVVGHILCRRVPLGGALESDFRQMRSSSFGIWSSYWRAGGPRTRIRSSSSARDSPRKAVVPPATRRGPRQD